MQDSFREAAIGFGTSWPLHVANEYPSIMPPLFRMDYLWHSSHFHTLEAMQGPRLGSDHLPLIAIVQQ